MSTSAGFWACLELVNMTKVPVRSRPLVPGGGSNAIEIKCPPGTSSDVVRMVSTMDMDIKSIPALDECDLSKRDSLLIDDTLVPIFKTNEFVNWNILWKALNMCVEYNIPLDTTSTTLVKVDPIQWRLGLVECQDINGIIHANIPMGTPENVIWTAQVLNVPDSFFPRGPDSDFLSFQKELDKVEVDESFMISTVPYPNASFNWNLIQSGEEVPVTRKGIKDTLHNVGGLIKNMNHDYSHVTNEMPPWKDTARSLSRRYFTII